MSEPLQTLHLYKRRADGAKVPYDIKIDKELVIVEEGFPEPVAGKVSIPAALAGALHSRTADTLTKRGVTFHAEGNALIIDKVPPQEMRIIDFFMPSKPCPFPNCEGLRESYLKEAKALDDGDCEDCEKATLMRKYREMIEPLLLSPSPA